MADLITLNDLDKQQLDALADRSIAFYKDRQAHDKPLHDLVAGMMFLQTSTRTRVAFSSAAVRLGADVVSFGPHDLQINTGESLDDTGRVLAAMLDLLVVRTGGSSRDLRALGQYGRLPMVSAMTADEHPTQAVSDIATLRLRYGDLAGLRFLYVGEGNNTAAALAKGLSLIPRCQATFWTPGGYGLSNELVDRCRTRASAEQGDVMQVTSPDELPTGVDVVYTTRWNTTGTTKFDPAWREQFRPFCVDEKFMSAHPSALVMHDLPAHRGDEITGAVLDGSRSIAWMQAAMKMPSAMAVLERAVTGSGTQAGSEAPWSATN